MKPAYSIRKGFILFLLPVLSLTSCDLPDIIPKGSAQELPRFTSCKDISQMIEKNRQEEDKRYGVLYDLAVPSGGTGVASNTAPLGSVMKSSEASPQTSSDFSKTNVQVEGVDEADIVKTDGTYIYTLSKNILYIVQALPPQEMKVIARITFDTKDNQYSNPTEFFINGENLAIFGTRNIEDSPIPMEDKRTTGSRPSYYPYYPTYRSGTFIDIYNLSDPLHPILKRTIETEGNYLTSRMIGNKVYAIINSYPSYTPPYYPMMESEQNRNSGIAIPTEKELLPLYRDTGTTSNSYAPIARCGDIHYVPNPTVAQYLTILSLPINEYSTEVDKNITFGAGENVYASVNNLYIARSNWSYNDWRSDSESNENTTIYKFSFENGKTKYRGEGIVPGTILNQFSMDEFEENFRIATTEGHLSRGESNTSNNIYILNSELKQLGAVTNIAPGEKIYSARFMGKKGYLVTFKKVDPFFVFDLSDPRNPKTLGKLKIPGYSDYLHPYDENHIIGIGKDTIEAEGGNFAWYQGVKMAIFDVTDVENPKEMYKTVIGDRGTDSPALSNHKAFLFDRSKNLLVIPVSVAEIQDPIIKEKIRNVEKLDNPVYGDFVFQGAYVYNLTLTNGFDLKGKISHMTDPDVYKKAGYYMGDYDSQIQRSLYIDNHLYTISNNKIMSNNLMESLGHEGEVSLTDQNPNNNTNEWIVE
jgi:uncharacterized secreted protein with C-terminal beta-propeller domain